jgi:hypothetical protein
VVKENKAARASQERQVYRKAGATYVFVWEGAAGEITSEEVEILVRSLKED